MDKKLQVMKNMNKDVKGYSGRQKKFDNINVRGTASRTNLTRPYYQMYHIQSRNEYKKSTKTDICPSLSLKNQDFIMANARLLVKQGLPSITDVCSNWDNIVQVNFESQEEVNCPICLNPPLVPRTYTCGHVYCLTCLLKYLSLKNDFHNKCALCGQLINIQMVKRASIKTISSFNTSDVISMILMKRDKVGSPPLPVNMFINELLHFNSPESRFSHVTVCPNENLLSIIKMEIITLEDELSAALLEEGNDRIECISEALESLKYEFKLTSNSVSIKPIKVTTSDIETFDDFKNIKSSNNVYYQSEDGSNVFMCPISWKCMYHEYLERGLCLPNRICAPIIDIEKFVVTEDFQNHYRYLQFLPLGSYVNFVELDLKEVVSATTLNKFCNVLQQRNECRIRKQKMDEFLTFEKIKHENSFNTASKFIHLDSLMNRRNSELFIDDDFVPLSNSSVLDKPNLNFKGNKKSFADMLQKRSVTQQMNSLSVTEVVNDDSQPRGFCPSDCLVVKQTKRK